MTRGAAYLLGLVGVAACGTHADDDIPDDLLEAIRRGEQQRDDYPSGSTGSRVGDLAPNVCVEGWSDPEAAEFDEGRLTRLCFADFWDPGGTEHRLLLVNTAAIWCGACQVEYAGSNARPSLAEEAEARWGAGLRVLGTLFQDADRNPATVRDGVLWAQSFGVDFPFGIDPGFAMGAFADPAVQPFNLVLDTRSMRVVLRVQGDNPSVLWPAIDERLDAE